MRRWRAVGAFIVAVAVTVALAGCSTNGTLNGPGGSPTGSGSSTGAAPTGHSLASGLQGSPTTSSSSQDVTVSQVDEQAALSAYQSANNSTNAALDTAAEAKIESGSLLALDQASLLYTQGVGGDAAAKVKVPISFTKPQFYPVRSTYYPRWFFVTVDAVQTGEPDAPSLLHFTQDHAGAPWLVDTTVALTAGKQWPAFAVDSDGALDYAATKLDQLPLSTTDLVAADRKTL